ncbi:hypothetical protein ACFL0Z_00460 [Patescibacteria group bacterium]
MVKQKGQAAIIAITALAVIGLIVATAVAAMSLSEYKMTDEAAKGNEVFTATESKMSDLLMRIKKDPSWPPDPLPYSESDPSYLNDVAVEATIDETDDGLQLDTIGTKSSITRHLRAILYSDTGQVNVFEIEP